MNKKRTFTIVGVLIAFVVILSVTKPSGSSFNVWLTKEYGMECDAKKCSSNVSGNTYTIINKDAEDYFLFKMEEIELHNQQEGGFKFVEGIGVLGGFIPFTYKPYYEK
jgi:hypothetical protein